MQGASDLETGAAASRYGVYAPDEEATGGEQRAATARVPPTFTHPRLVGVALTCGLLMLVASAAMPRRQHEASAQASTSATTGSFEWASGSTGRHSSIDSALHSVGMRRAGAASAAVPDSAFGYTRSSPAMPFERTNPFGPADSRRAGAASAEVPEETATGSFEWAASHYAAAAHFSSIDHALGSTFDGKRRAGAASASTEAEEAEIDETLGVNHFASPARRQSEAIFEAAQFQWTNSKQQRFDDLETALEHLNGASEEGQ